MMMIHKTRYTNNYIQSFIAMKNNIEKQIKKAESKHKWMKITKKEWNGEDIYMIQDMRFGDRIPFNVYKHSLTESELSEELKSYLD